MNPNEPVSAFENYGNQPAGNLTSSDSSGSRAAHGGQIGVSSMALELVQQVDLDAALETQLSNDYLLPGDVSIDPEVITAFKPVDRSADEIRALRSQLMLRGFASVNGRNMLAIVSPQSKDGRSFVAANLAVAFAQLGLRTLLVDADFRKPRQGKLFRSAETLGLAGILAGRAGTEVVTPVATLPGLHVLTAGAIPHNPQDLISKPIFSQLLNNAAKKFAVVIVDTPAADTASDAEIIAACTSAALVVIRKHKSRLNATNTFAQQLQRSGVSLVGSVLNQY